MARGNQRDKAREKTQAKLASQVCPYLCILPDNTDQNADTGKKNTEIWQHHVRLRAAEGQGSSRGDYEEEAGCR